MGLSSVVIPLWIGLVDRVEHIREWSDNAKRDDLRSLPAKHLRHLLISLSALSVLCIHKETREGLKDDIEHIITRINKANGGHPPSRDARGTGAVGDDVQDTRRDGGSDAAVRLSGSVPCPSVVV